ncbi:hypothetical protein DVH05_000480 [Phytophthora capsici]|nr:hypothetical protein DVH05_000480 [Phytophthora capsici]
MVKDDLIKIVDQHRPKPSYRVVELAAEHGHHVYYTPPYHPSLQPIELIWAQIKGPIARHPANNAAETIQKVEEGLKAVDDQWVSVFRHVQKIEDAFIKAATRPDGSNVKELEIIDAEEEKDS